MFLESCFSIIIIDLFDELDCTHSNACCIECIMKEGKVVFSLSSFHIYILDTAVHTSTQNVFDFIEHSDERLEPTCVIN